MVVLGDTYEIQDRINISFVCKDCLRWALCSCLNIFIGIYDSTVCLIIFYIIFLSEINYISIYNSRKKIC